MEMERVFLVGQQGLPSDCNFSSLLLPGNRSEPLVFKGKKLFMRGWRILNSALGELVASRGLVSATDVLVNGGSAGGLAVVLHLDHIASLLSWAKVRGVVCAGYFLDFPDVNVRSLLLMAFVVSS